MSDLSLPLDFEEIKPETWRCVVFVPFREGKGFEGLNGTHLRDCPCLAQNGKLRSDNGEPQPHP